MYAGSRISDGAPVSNLVCVCVCARAYVVGESNVLILHVSHETGRLSSPTSVASKRVFRLCLILGGRETCREREGDRVGLNCEYFSSSSSSPTQRASVFVLVSPSPLPLSPRLQPEEAKSYCVSRPLNVTSYKLIQSTSGNDSFLWTERKYGAFRDPAAQEGQFVVPGSY